jgi:hypothetical protein
VEAIAIGVWAGASCFSALLLIGAINKYTDASRKLEIAEKLYKRALLMKKGR